MCSYIKTLQESINDHVLFVLGECHYSTAAACVSLELSKKTLRKYIKKIRGQGVYIPWRVFGSGWMPLTKRPLGKFRADYITKVLEENNWNRKESSRTLDISTRTIYNHVVKFFPEKIIKREGKIIKHEGKNPDICFYPFPSNEERLIHLNRPSKFRYKASRRKNG